MKKQDRHSKCRSAIVSAIAVTFTAIASIGGGFWSRGLGCSRICGWHQGVCTPYQSKQWKQLLA